MSNAAVPDFLFDPNSTPGVRNEWNAVTTRDSSSSYRQLDEHTNRVAINITFVIIFSVASFRP